MSVTRGPRYSESEMHALIDGTIRRWKILSTYNNSDRIKQTKEAAWKEIEQEVNAVNTSGVRRKWQDLRRKVQVEKSNVKRKVQEIRRNRRNTGNNTEIPKLSDFEEKVASLLKEEEVSGIDGGFALGLPVAETQQDVRPHGSMHELYSHHSDTCTSTQSTDVSDVAGAGTVEGTQTTATKTRMKTKTRTTSKKTNSALQRENLLLQKDNLKRQATVLKLQEKYYTLKLAKLQGPIMNSLMNDDDETM